MSTTDQTSVTGIPGPDIDSVNDALLSVADRVVEIALGRGAVHAEAYVQTSSSRSMSIERDTIGFTSSGGESGIGLRVIKDDRLGFAYFSNPADQADAAERALLVAARAKPSEYRFPERQQVPRVEGLWDDKVAHLDTDQIVDSVRGIIAGAKEVDPSATVSGGSFGLGLGATAIVNSEGVQVAERGTGIGMSAYVVLKSGATVTTGFEGYERNTLDDTIADPNAVGQKACELAKSGQDAKAFGDGKPTTVVFHPDAASALVEFITIPALHGDKAARGESLFAGKLGEQVTDPRLMITDDPTRPHGLGSGAVDDEGLASRPVPLIDKGVVSHYLYDLGSAYEHGGGPGAATASGIRSGGLSSGRTYQETPGTGARNVVVGTTDATSLDELIGGIDNGILVHDLLGAHTANPTSGDFSVSSTVLFRIRDGALDGALKSVMLAGNVPDLLRDHVIGSSTETEKTTGHFSPIGLEVPYLALDKVHVVGG